MVTPRGIELNFFGDFHRVSVFDCPKFIIATYHLR